MSQGNYEAAYCEHLHSYIMEEFHKWRKKNNLPINVTMNGNDLSRIIGPAKLRLYSERPEAEKAGFKIID
ncbi:hypothetical protein LCGC14_0544350 [marine sediment metagenome]|uniref:Uncharacterized protein n=1 Tax=marine sediment metagenome TaxID=412755 RepID=A0A0F9V026_9ZZZZ